MKIKKLIFQIKKNPIQFLIYLFVFFLPLQTTYIVREVFLHKSKWEYLTISFYISDIILLLIFAIFLVSNIKYFKKIKKFKLSKITLTLLFLSLFSFASIIWAPDKELALFSAVKLSFAIAFFFVILNTKINWRKLMFVFIFTAMLQGAFGLWQFFNQYSPANKYLGISEHKTTTIGTSVVHTVGEKAEDYRRWLRSYGGFSHPNILGGFLAIMLIFIVNIYSEINEKEEPTFKDLYIRLFLLFSLIAIFAGMITSFSRNAWLVAGLSFLAFFIIHFKDRKESLLKTSFIFSVILIFFIINFSNLFLSRFTLNNHLEIQSIEERVKYTQQAKDLIKDHPWFGVGIGNYTLADYNKLQKKLPAWYYQPVHNVFLLIIAELGIIGLLLFLLFLVLLLKNFHKQKNNVFLLAVFSFLIMMFFDHWIWSSHFGLFFFFLISAFYYKKSFQKKSS